MIEVNKEFAEFMEKLKYHAKQVENLHDERIGLKLDLNILEQRYLSGEVKETDFHVEKGFITNAIMSNLERTKEHRDKLKEMDHRIVAVSN